MTSPANPILDNPEPTAGSELDERRRLVRLRELCDEILASRRVDEGRDLMTEEERREARALLAGFAPRAGTRESLR
ncbi:MAG: hypothetical protein ACXW05_16130 [Gemmatirosa sp.]